MPQRYHHVGLCLDHRLPCWLSRKNARGAARELYPGQHLRALQCGDSHYWHLVQLAVEVRQGLVTCDGQPAEQRVIAPNPTAAAQIRAMWAATTSPATPAA